MSGRSTAAAGWNRRGIAAVIARDLRVIRGSKPVVLPMLIVPAVLLIVLPAVVGASARLGAEAVDLADLDQMLAMLPPEVGARVAADPAAGVIELALVHLLSPLLLIIPMMTSSVIAADSLAGERERRTLEGLLLTPLTDRELFVAKLLGAWLPAVGIGLAGGIVYAVVGDVVAAGVVDGLLFPNLLWIVLVLWLGPAIAAISLGLTVIVSARVKTVQEAFQIAGVVVLPVVALIVTQAAGVLAVSPLLLFAVGVAAWAVAAVVLRGGMRAVSRTRLGQRL